MSSSMLKIGGTFRLQVLSKEGDIKHEEEIDNGWVNNGLKHLMDRTFKGSPPTQATFYIGLIDGSPTLSDDDAIDSHSGWSEVTAYAETERQAWGQDDPVEESGNLITAVNSTAASFNINGTVTAGGAFIVTDDTKSGTTGTLIATGVFSSDLSLENGDILKIFYSLKAQAA